MSLKFKDYYKFSMCKVMNHNLYWESQKGGLCRLHALNAYFGHQKLKDTDFIQYCKEYDQYIHKIYKETITSQDYDIFPSCTLVAYIIKRIENKYSYFIGLDQLKSEKQSLEKLINKSKSFFVFNTNHIYVVKLHNGKWYKIDSMSGIIQFDLNKLNGRRTGFIIPRNTSDLNYDISLLTDKIKSYLTLNKINTTVQLHDWINKNYTNILLGDLEVYLSHLNEIMEIKNEHLIPLYKLVIGFYSDKNNQKWISKFLPRTLMTLNLIIKPKKT